MIETITWITDGSLPEFDPDQRLKWGEDLSEGCRVSSGTIGILIKHPRTQPVSDAHWLP